MSPLIQGLNYRSACDNTLLHYACFRVIIFMKCNIVSYGCEMVAAPGDQYESQPYLTVFTDSSGLISSPNFPQRYPENIYLRYNIRAPSLATIKLQFLEFNLCESKWQYYMYSQHPCDGKDSLSVRVVFFYATIKLLCL